MKNFKIYRDGKYDTKENIKFKFGFLIHNYVDKIDHFLEKY